MSRTKEHICIDSERDVSEDSFLYSLRRKEEVMPFSGILNKELQDQQSEELNKGIEALAPKEKTLFLLSLEGKSKEFIMESMNIKERNYFGLKRRAIIKMRNAINSNIEMEKYN